ncbi:MAG: hypothetical protein WCK90_04945 [archaeon]
MTNAIENNAYRILGLDISASQKDILKRYKEIINRLKIDDHPEYTLDINLAEKYRNETTVTDALKKLQNQKSNLKEYFFWFQINDKIDEKALEFLKKEEPEKAIQTWKSASKSENSTSYVYKKNLLVLYGLLLSEKNNLLYLKESLSLWYELINSDKFWNGFVKKYSLNNEQTVSSTIISEFKSNIRKYLSDVYTDLHKQHKHNNYVKDFQEIFGTHGERTEKNVLQPIYKSIYESIEELSKIEINEEIEEKDISNVDKIIGSIQEDLKKLEEMGSYKTDQSKVVRDHVSEAIREKSISLYNHSTFLEESSKLLKIALKIVGTESLKNKLEEDTKIIKKNEKNMISVEIPGFFSNKKVTFHNSFVEYKDKKIFYKDIEWVSYIATSHSVNGIPTGTTYKFRLTSENDEIALSPGDEELWTKLINLSKTLIEPVLVNKIVKNIFEKSHTYDIGGVIFSKTGYHRDKFFGGKDEVLWKGTVYIPKYHAGNVILFKDEEGQGASFKQIPMSEGNSVIIPELVGACVQYYYSYVKKPKAGDR